MNGHEPLCFLGLVYFLFQDSKLNFEKQRSVSLLHVSGTEFLSSFKSRLLYTYRDLSLLPLIDNSRFNFIFLRCVFYLFNNCQRSNQQLLYIFLYSGLCEHVLAVVLKKTDGSDKYHQELCHGYW